VDEEGKVTKRLKARKRGMMGVEDEKDVDPC
jgi:hypothetical protein